VVHRTVAVTDWNFKEGQTAMNIAHLPLLAILLAAISVSGQDSKPNEFESFPQVKESVRRITSQHIRTGWDEKAFNRSGDMVAIVIVKTIPESELTSPTTMKEVLGILHGAFACPSRCIAALGNQQPNVTMLLLEHLHSRTSGPLQSEIDETRDFIVQQTRIAE
jgi:hypothetical protein